MIILLFEIETKDEPRPVMVVLEAEDSRRGAHEGWLTAHAMAAGFARSTVTRVTLIGAEL